MANREMLAEIVAKEETTEIESNSPVTPVNPCYRGLPVIAAVLLVLLAFTIGAISRGFKLNIKSIEYVTQTSAQTIPVDGSYDNEPPMSTSPGTIITNPSTDTGVTTSWQNNNLVTTKAPSNNTVPGIKSNSTADIISYFNTAVNNMKAARPGLTKIESATPSNIEISSLPNWLTGVKDYIVETFITSKNSEKKLKKGEDNLEVVSVYKETWASKLTAGDVLNCTYTTTSDGKYYEIKFYIKPETNPGDRGKSAHGRIFSIITQDYILEKAKDASFMGIKATIQKENITLKYYDSNVFCRIEKSTGRVVYMKTECLSDADVKQVKLGFISTDFQGTVLSEITFKDFVY